MSDLARALADSEKPYLDPADRGRRVGEAVAAFFPGAKVVGLADSKRIAYREWLEEAAVHGRKPGWAAYRYKERYGHWPPWKVGR